MRRLRLLHVFSTFDAGGPQVRVVRMIEQWCARGEPFEHLICAHDGRMGAQALLPAGAPVAQVHDMPLRQPGLLLPRLRALGAYLRDAPVDLVCTYNWGAMDVVLANRLFARRPLVHHEEGFELAEAERPDWRRTLYRRLALPGARCIVTVSRRLEDIARQVWRQPSERIVHLPNGVDLAAFAGLPRSDALPGLVRQPGELVIGTVARLGAIKNLPLLVRAAARVGADRALRLVIVGAGPQAQAIRQTAALCGMTHRLLMPGFLARPQDFIGLFDIFALSSISEQAPLSLLEAMAAGLPCAVTDVGDCAAMLPAVSRRCVSASGDEQGLAQSLRWLSESQARRAELGQANRAEAVARFSMDAMMRRYEALYESVAVAATSPSFAT